MLTCRDVHSLGSDYLDGRLSRRERWAVQIHLPLCRDCRRYLHQIRQTARLAQESFRDIPDSGTEERLLVSIRRDS